MATKTKGMDREITKELAQSMFRSIMCDPYFEPIARVADYCSREIVVCENCTCLYECLDFWDDRASSMPSAVGDREDKLPKMMAKMIALYMRRKPIFAHLPIPLDKPDSSVI